MSPVAKSHVPINPESLSPIATLPISVDVNNQPSIASDGVAKQPFDKNKNVGFPVITTGIGDPSDVIVKLRDPNGSLILGRLRIRPDGRKEISFHATGEGVYRAEARSKGQPLKGCPLPLEVVPEIPIVIPRNPKQAVPGQPFTVPLEFNPLKMPRNVKVESVTPKNRI